MSFSNTSGATPALEDLFAPRARETGKTVVGAAQQRPTKLISFAYGLADPALFPTDEITAATARVMKRDAAAALNYGMSYAGLTEQIIGRLHAEGVEAEAENILVSYGSSQVLALLPEVFVEPGDVVIIEGPSFMGAVKRFALAGAKLVTVPVDAQGMDVDALEVTLRDLARQGVRPKFIYTIPTFHNPSGVTMPLERRQKLVALGAQYGVLIVEDDAYGDLRYDGQPIPHLAALDDSGWVMRVGTYSKILAPGMRTGWAYARPEIIERMIMFKLEGSSGPFLTRVVAQFAADGRLERHIEALRKLYRSKRDVMLDAIDAEFVDGVKVVRPDGGFFVWCTLPDGMSATKLLARSEELGASFLPGTACFANGQGDNAIRLAFSFQPAEKITEGMALIGKAMRDM